MPQVTVSALRIYPVKSLAGTALNNATVLTSGLLGDREWMIVNEDMRFCTQRQIPALAKIGTTLNADRTLVLSSSDSPPMTVHPQACTQPARVQVWKDRCSAYLAPKEVNQWLTEQSGTRQPLKLVYFDKTTTRPTNPERFGEFHTYFADGSPFLLCNEASLQAVNQQQVQQQRPLVDMQRFRPSIVIEGLPAFAEHQYRELYQADKNIVIGLRDHCQRCAVITVDQLTGERVDDGTLLKTIATINSMPDRPKAPAFGVNAVLYSGDGAQLSVGDVCTVR